jgi:hypothetical protein
VVKFDAIERAVLRYYLQYFLLLRGRKFNLAVMGSIVLTVAIAPYSPYIATRHRPLVVRNVVI